MKRFLKINGRLYSVAESATEHELFWISSKIGQVETSTCPIFVFVTPQGRFALVGERLNSPYHSRRLWRWGDFPTTVGYDGHIVCAPSPKSKYGVLFADYYVGEDEGETAGEVFPCLPTMWGRVRRRLPDHLFETYKNLIDEWVDKFGPVAVVPVQRTGENWMNWEIVPVPAPRPKKDGE